MEHYKIIFAYDGTSFQGSQRQAKARTAQSELENALRRLDWQGKSVSLAGRTDCGVHASGQVAAFDLEWKHDLSDLVRALNANLPHDMAVSAAEIVPDGFHPRFDAVSRTYQYRLYCQPVRDPMRDRYAWRQNLPLDETTLQEAARKIRGTHDFAAFGTPPRPGNSSLRTVMKAGWFQKGDEWTFVVQANAFLYHMVRRLVFIQVAIGQDRLPLQVITEMLTSPATPAPAGLAPANGLNLVEVRYPEQSG